MIMSEIYIHLNLCTLHCTRYRLYFYFSLVKVKNVISDVMCIKHLILEAYVLIVFHYVMLISY